MNIIQLPLAILAVTLCMLIAKEASAQQTVIIHQPVQRVIVEHHYPAGVTHIPGQGGSRTYVYGGHYGPSTCYRECFHQGVQGGRVIIVNPQRPRRGFSFGFSAYDHRGSGGSFQIHDYR